MGRLERQGVGPLQVRHHSLHQLPEPHFPVAPPPDEECERRYDLGVGVGAQNDPGLTYAGLNDLPEFPVVLDSAVVNHDELVPLVRRLRVRVLVANVSVSRPPGVREAHVTADLAVGVEHARFERPQDAPGQDLAVSLALDHHGPGLEQENILLPPPPITMLRLFH